MIKKVGTLGGLFLGIFSIFGAFLIEGGSVKALFLIAPMLVVFGGTFSAVIIGFGFENFINIFNLIRKAYFPEKYEHQMLIDFFVEISGTARMDGVLSIENKTRQLKYIFPKKLVRLVIDGTDQETLQTLAALEIKAMQERHYSNIFIFTKMGGYAPTMGIIGTVMGLIMTLANAGGEPITLINNIASAFIATLWGVVSANLLWLPIADKLKECHLEEKHMMELSLEGVIALQNGEIPSIVRARLLSMLPQSEQEAALAY